MSSIKPFFLATLFTAGLIHLPLGASLLVYEGFSGYSTSALAGQAANGTGLTGNWVRRGNVDTNVTATGLTFGSLATSGGAVTVSLDERAGSEPANRISVLGAELNLPSSVNGTLYSSMLFNFTSLGTQANNLATMRVADDNQLTSNVRLSTYPVGQNTVLYSPAVSYTGSPQTSAEVLGLNITYMAISIFTNVGTSLTAGNPGVANMYVLNLAQFEDFVANGSSEANLVGRGIGFGATEINAVSTHSLTSGSFSFADGNFMGLASFVNEVSNSNGRILSGTYDELRWGTSLDSIAVIPEPSTLFLLGGSVLVFSIGCLRRRR